MNVASVSVGLLCMAGGKMRPDWWPKWLPDACAEGHRYDDGISWTWENCDCPASGKAGGHQVAFCRVIGCRAQPARPPGHTGPAREQR